MKDAIARWLLVGLVAGAAVAAQTLPAEACKFDMVGKPRRHRPHSLHPSEVLLFGSPPSRLAHDLAAEGNHVEVTSVGQPVRRHSYAVVVVDQDRDIVEADERFLGAIVVVRSEDIAHDLQVVDAAAARWSSSDYALALVARSFEQLRAARAERERFAAHILQLVFADPTSASDHSAELFALLALLGMAAWTPVTVKAAT